MSKAFDISNNNGQNNMFTIDGGEINNVQYVVASISRSLILNDLSIENADYGALLYFCPGSMITNCYFVYKELVL